MLDWLGDVELYEDWANRLKPPTRPVPRLTEQQINQRDAGKSSSDASRDFSNLPIYPEACSHSSS